MGARLHAPPRARPQAGDCRGARRARSRPRESRPRRGGRRPRERVHGTARMRRRLQAAGPDRRAHRRRRAARGSSQRRERPDTSGQPSRPAPLRHRRRARSCRAARSKRFRASVAAIESATVRPDSSSTSRTLATAEATSSPSRERSERHPPDAVSICIRQLRGELKREARLAGATWPGQREDANSRLGRARDELGELVLAAEERGGGHRQVRPVQRPQRRELLVSELMEDDGGREVLEPVRAKVAKGHVAGSSSATVEGESTTCPPWPHAPMRAARWTSIPT